MNREDARKEFEEITVKIRELRERQEILLNGLSPTTKRYQKSPEKAKALWYKSADVRSYVMNYLSSGVTQMGLADSANLSARTVYCIVEGDYETVTDKVADALMIAMDCNVNDLQAYVRVNRVLTPLDISETV